MSGSSTANRGDDVPHLSSRRCSAHKRRSRCLSGVQWSGGLCNHSSARTVEHTGPYPLVQPSAQRHGTMRVDFAGQPQASPDQQRQDHPHDAHLDWTRLSSAYTCPRARGGATRGSCTVRPWTSTRYRPLVKVERDDDSLQRIAMGRCTTGRRTVSAAIRRQSKAVPCVTLNVLQHSVQRQRWSWRERRRRWP